MSRIGRKPINIPEGVEVGLNANQVNVKGKLGELSFEHQSSIQVEINENVARKYPYKGDKLHLQVSNEIVD